MLAEPDVILLFVSFAFSWQEIDIQEINKAVHADRKVLLKDLFLRILKG